jgi:hypothetical protein
VSLKKFLFLARTQLEDYSVQNVKEPLLIAAANEGKNELVKLIRRARQDYFQKFLLMTVPIADPLDPSEINLPDDFAVLKDLQIKTVGYENVKFFPVDRSSELWRQAVINRRFNSQNSGYFFYDIGSGSNTPGVLSVLKLAPGSDLILDLKVVYDGTVLDMEEPDDEPTPIPPEHWDYIVTWMVCNALRTKGDQRFLAFDSKLKTQGERVVDSVGIRQVRDPVFVTGYLENEWYG